MYICMDGCGCVYIRKAVLGDINIRVRHTKIRCDHIFLVAVVTRRSGLFLWYSFHHTLKRV